LGQGLRSSIVHTLGVTLAVQVRRYFVDTVAQLNTSLPQSPVRDEYIRQYIRLSTGKGLDLTDISTKPPGWLLTRLITPAGESMQSPARRGTGQVYSSLARTTTIATIDELNVLREAIRSKEIGNDSSSKYLMDRRHGQHRLINDPKPGQPANLLPTFLLRGMVVTNGRTNPILYIRSGCEAKDFVGYIGLRRAHCLKYHTWYHRDLMAAANMVEAGHLQHLSRPLYLLPISEDGKWVHNPWYGPSPTPEVPAGKMIDR
ncbi:hypothetical protein BGX28_005596, partial [Mortierella sp. GBA30]